jgi:hypothetical protein
MVGLMQTYNDLPENTVILRFDIDGSLVGFLAASATALHRGTSSHQPE